jgi:hypothetical protein
MPESYGLKNLGVENSFAKSAKTDVVAVVVQKTAKRQISKRWRRAGLPLAVDPGGGFSGFRRISAVGNAVLVERRNCFLRKRRGRALRSGRRLGLGGGLEEPLQSPHKSSGIVVRAY